MRASSVARLISARVMSSSRLSRSFLAASFPFAPAMLYHMCASTESLRTPPPIGVPDPKVVLRIGKPLVGSQPIPFHGFGIVLGDALADAVHEPEVELRRGVVLFGGEAKPAHGLGIVRGNAKAPAVPVAQFDLRLGVALFGGEAKPAHGFGIVLGDAFAIVVYDPEIELCGGITLFRSLPDRVEIVLCREHHDGEATRHEHGSRYADQPWCFIYRLQM